MAVEPTDAVPDPVTGEAYWIGYYNGKAAAMRNLGTLRRIELERSRRRLRSTSRIVAAIDLVVAVAGFYVIWPGRLGDASFLAHFATGVVFGSWIGGRLHWWWH
jgi:hypothetical protein